MTVRLPSRNELCQFALKPISHNVGDLLAMLKAEDRGIDRAAVINRHGVRIASSCTIDSLLDDSFRWVNHRYFWISLTLFTFNYSIQINNRTLEVIPPKRERITVESVDKVGDVRKVIAQVRYYFTNFFELKINMCTYMYSSTRHSMWVNISWRRAINLPKNWRPYATNSSHWKRYNKIIT